ncbi:ADP-ribosylglycohydrolase family protein [bacterium]|nr:ADP-ribosylglycohydrolase family protein [bacterium]
MLGAIIGDIVGSIYEFNNIRTKDFPFWGMKNYFTDDSVMTLAVAKALMAGGKAEDFVQSMQELGRLFPRAGYGGRFRHWLVDPNPKPYNSWGNGSAMRVSPTAWVGKTLEEVQNLAKASAEVTHNHPEGIKGAQATASAIFLARTGHSKEDIKNYIVKTYNYNLNFTIDEIRSTYQFNESCQDSVPQAIVGFLEGTDFVDTIRNVISIGGDCDTTGAIAGAIAEGFYGIPGGIAKKGLLYLPQSLRQIYDNFQNFLKVNS